MSIEWYSSKDLEGINGLPSHATNITRKAVREEWIKRDAKGVKGGGYEYHYSSFPKSVQKELGFEPVEPVKEPTQPPFATVVTEKKDMVTVPQFDLTASAGNGSYVVAESPVAEFTFSHDWIIEQGLHNKKLTVVPVRGDSMEDKLHDGDLLIVSIVEDMREAREGICVVRYVDEIFVKRVHFDWKSRGYKIISDNEAYDNMFIDEEDITSGRFQVVGKMEFKLQRTKNA